MEQKDTVTMVKGDQTAEVTPDDSVKIMEEQGWKLAGDDPSLAALKAEADSLGVGYPSNVTSDQLTKKLADFKALKPAATFTAKHKGGGKFEVLDPEGKVVAEGLSKADAEAKAAELNKPAA